MREMLRIKRSVQATYNTQVNMMAAQFMSNNTTEVNTNADAMRLLDAKASEANNQQQKTTATALKPQTSSNIMFVRGETQGGSAKDKVVNPDEIDIGDSDEDMDDDDDDEDEENNSNETNDMQNSKVTRKDDNDVIMKKLRIEQKSIPAKVFGGLKPTNNDEEEDD